jgi:hypothetical protein
MPITDLASYLPTMDEFIVHWSAVNAALRERGEEELTLRDGTTLPEFIDARASLVARMAEVERAEHTRRQVQEERDYLQEELRARLIQFQAAVLEQMSGTRDVDWVSTLPSLIAAETRYLGQLDAAAEVWERIDSELGAPLPLANGYTLRQFREDVRRFRAASRALRIAQGSHRTLTWERNRLRRTLMDWLTKYRCVVRFDRVVDPELLYALPARTPSSYRPAPLYAKPGSAVEA